MSTSFLSNMYMMPQEGGEIKVLKWEADINRFFNFQFKFKVLCILARQEVCSEQRISWCW